jgi:molybdenum cofactor cytidylyltransferase
MNSSIDPVIAQKVSAVVLAAGMSKRMGRAKMILAWKDTTVIGQVISTLLSAGMKDVTVVTGGARDLVAKAIRDFPIRTVFNPGFENGEMLTSIQIGLQSLPIDSQAAMIVLGDQPWIEGTIVRSLLDYFLTNRPKIVIPSYSMRRGHPWIVARPLWPYILELKPPLTLRNFSDEFKEDIHFLNVSSPSILKDLDTPDDYQEFEHQ